VGLRTIFWVPFVHILDTIRIQSSHRQVCILCYLSNVLPFECSLTATHDVAGFIPEDPSTFVVLLSDRLARFASHLTLDFITEVSSGMEKATPAQRITCLQYLSPWMPNLAKYCDPANALYEHSGARLRDAIRLLVDLTTADHGVSSIASLPGYSF
jgi:hypothetical protein